MTLSWDAVTIQQKGKYVENTWKLTISLWMYQDCNEYKVLNSIELFMEFQDIRFLSFC